jgi:hypothetical protein
MTLNHANGTNGPFNQTAQILLDNGFSPVPTRPDDSKRPIEDGWQQRRHTAVAGPLNGHAVDGCNVGVACGFNGLVAIDIDEDDWHAIYLDYIRPIIDVFPPGKVGARGITLFYRLEGGGTVTSQTVKASDGAKLFEIRGVGNHTAIPPSVHPTTMQPYKWHGGTVGERVVGRVNP